MWAVFPGKKKERKRKKKKTINILNQFLSENLPPPEPMGGLFKCKVLHKHRSRVRDQEPVIETHREKKKTDGERQRERERENMPTNNSGKWGTVEARRHKEINE